MSEETSAAPAAATTAPNRLVDTARTPFRALNISALVATGIALLLLFVSFTGGYVEPAILAAALLILAAPLFAGAAIIAALGKRERD